MISPIAIASKRLKRANVSWRRPVSYQNGDKEQRMLELWRIRSKQHYFCNWERKNLRLTPLDHSLMSRFKSSSPLLSAIVSSFSFIAIVAEIVSTNLRALFRCPFFLWLHLFYPLNITKQEHFFPLFEKLN